MNKTQGEAAVITYQQLIVAGVVMTVAWILVGVAIGRWIWGG